MARDERREAFLRAAARAYDEAMVRAGGERPGRFDDMEEQAEEEGRKVARQLLADQLAEAEEAAEKKVVCCPECGEPMRRPKKKALRNLDTFSGTVRYERRHAICDRCRTSFSPSGPFAGDSAAGSIGTVQSQGL
jgi:hypothetical protein